MKNNRIIRLRPATLDDVEPLTALSYRTIRVKYPDVIGAVMVEGYIASGAVPQYYTVDLMMVTIDRHRSGVGSALLSEAESMLFADHEVISLESFRDNRQAIDFYTKHGWVMQESFTDPDYGIAMVRMTKQIEGPGVTARWRRVISRQGD